MKIYWDGKSKNIIGSKIKQLRKQKKLTQKHMAELLQLQGHEFSDLTILRIEQGTRFVPDYEIGLFRYHHGCPSSQPITQFYSVMFSCFNTLSVLKKG